MICQAPSFLGRTEQDQQWSNWSGRTHVAVERVFTPMVPGHPELPMQSPSGLQQLVHVVAQASLQAKALHPVGSGWANTDMAASAQWMVGLQSLCSQLSYVVGGRPSALNDEWVARQADPNGATKLVHFEAGVEVGRAAEILDSLGLAFPTLGGANGQSLAGVISTSTHGGEWNQPPLPDMVRAIHLVTATGQELWIERASQPVTTDARLREVLPCAGTRIVRSDEVFDAAVVSFGRFGVIYSMVLEVRRAFRVVEVITRPPVQAVLDKLDEGRRQPNPFAALFALAATTPPPAGLVEGAALNRTDPPFFQLLFNSQDGDDFYLQRRWETTNPVDLNLPTPVDAPGCAIACGMNRLWENPLGPHAVRGILTHILNEQLKPAIEQGRRGPHWLVTSGTRAASHNKSYTGDGIEVVFDATRPEYLQFLRVILDAAPRYSQAGWISVRPSRASRATLSMHNVAGAHAMSIEATTATGLADNEAWLGWVHEQAMAYGGRPHWGQFNTVNERQVRTLYGAGLDNWKASLFEASGQSTTFSNAFSRVRGLEPAAGERSVSVTCPGTDKLLVVDAPRSLQDDRIGSRSWEPATGWVSRQPLDTLTAAPHATVASARIAGSDRAMVLAIGRDGMLYFRIREAGGRWSAWWIAGRSNEPAFQGIPGAAVHAVSCKADMVHAFYTDRQGGVLVSRADSKAGAGTLWPESTPLRAMRTRAGGHVTAVSRREGQLDAFVVGTDSKVYTAAWTAGGSWRGWWPIEGLTAIPGSHVAAVSKAQDQIDIFVADAAGRTMSAAWDPSSPSWKGWWHIQGGQTRPGGHVTAVSRSPGKLDIFTAGTDTQVYTAAWDASRGAWAGWWSIPGARALSKISVVSRSADKLDAFYVAGDGSVQSVAWSGGSWLGPWTLG
ncbi:MAG TPA: D-arabinono-1,4-lactone oxidase [Ramlibacter sp.]|uniref:FAD-binding protein n=1 Tax=Ramlibacter sp. TaxID=1917967 RepID=UPI002ED28960